MSAERLREAARVLRERAGAAAPGPWEVCDFNEGGSRPLWGVANEAFHNPPSDDQAPWLAVEVHTGAEADAAYIALMHPLVALALADWLDVAGADEWAHGPHCLTPCDDCDDDPRASHIRSALAVADAILGGDR